MAGLFKKQNNTLTHSFKCKNFKESILFINEIAQISESLNHHPDIHLHDYNQVSIFLTTHSLGKVTEKDIELGKKIEELYLHLKK